ncbi:matrixin family metalloprotease [Rheinheimera sp.]|uniref:matrixin family metalloprotease n=1 Tax=Rheinheimera sp. TaxID=1869214 RepID=UPI004048CAF8
MQQQQQRLQQRQQQLQQQQAQQLNEQQAQLQREQQYLNETVADRNALLPAQQELLAAEVGLMEVQNGQRTMTIFAYNSAATLQLTIAHEFGHALGLGHTDNSASVMHFALNPQQASLTAEDIAALAQQCGF